VNILLIVLGVAVVLCFNGVALVAFRENPNGQRSTTQPRMSLIITTLLIVASIICLGFVILNLVRVKSANPFLLLLTFALLLAFPIYSWVTSDTSLRRNHTLLLITTTVSVLVTIGTIIFYVLIS